MRDKASPTRSANKAQSSLKLLQESRNCGCEGERSHETKAWVRGSVKGEEVEEDMSEPRLAASLAAQTQAALAQLG